MFKNEDKMFKIALLFASTCMLLVMLLPVFAAVLHNQFLFNFAVAVNILFGYVLHIHLNDNVNCLITLCYSIDQKCQNILKRKSKIKLRSSSSDNVDSY